MSTTVGMYEAKTHFAELGERAAQGETIVVTKHGAPRFQMAPIEPDEKSRQEEARLAVEGIMKLRKGIRLDGLNLLELRDEGKR